MIEAKLLFGLLVMLVFSSLLRVQFNNQLRLYEKIILIFLFLSSLIVILSPALLDKIAKYLKIERGNDLLFYLYILISLWGLIRSHIRINKLTSSLNKVVSQLAIGSPIIRRRRYSRKNK